MKIRMSNGAILAYRRLPYRTWYAIGEFVDNAIDAYLRGSNKAQLDAAYATTGTGLTIDVVLDKQDNILRVVDNSIGMSMGEVEAAMVIGSPPPTTGGISEFGMGMKTAAVWFADSLEIRTKKLGEDNEVRVTFSVERFMSGDDELDVQLTPRGVDDHYTVVELRGLKRKIGVSGIGKTRKFLGSMYREFLREGSVTILFNNDPVELPTARTDTERFVPRVDGTPFLFDFGPWEIGDKTASGWVGILKPMAGFTGRNVAGFSIIRNRRTLHGWLDSWRPDELFGVGSRNDLLNQRLVGEIYLDGPFRPSHIKDGIDWESDDEEELGKRLRAFCEERNLLVEARKTRPVSSDDPEIERERAEALATIEAELTSPGMQDAMTLLDVPRPELARAAASVLIQAKSEDEFFPFQVGQVDGGPQMGRLYEVFASPNDPYCHYEVRDVDSDGGRRKDVYIYLNANHPAVHMLPGPEARIAHYHHVILDALSEYKCLLLSEPYNPGSIRMMKDRLFRTLAEFQDGS